MAERGGALDPLKERLLVLGGSGFIGRHVATTGAAAGLEVASLALDEPTERLPGVEYWTGDFTQEAILHAALEGQRFEYVINCAGYIEHTLYGQGGGSLITQHFDAVRHLAAVLDRDCLKGFVQLGSSDEYGCLPAPQNEGMREAPISPYSFGKVAATQFLQMLHHTEQFPAVVARLFLTYGPGQDDKRFLPQIIKGCLSGRPFPTSEGRQLRDFCHVRDVAAGLLKASRTPAARGEVINLASGQPVAIREMVETVCRLIGGGVPEFGQVPYRPGENMALHADITKASQLLEWRPEISLEEGLRELIDWGRRQGWAQ